MAGHADIRERTAEEERKGMEKHLNTYERPTTEVIACEETGRRLGGDSTQRGVDRLADGMEATSGQNIWTEQDDFHIVAHNPCKDKPSND